MAQLQVIAQLQMLLSEVRQQKQESRARCVVNDSPNLTIVSRRVSIFAVRRTYLR